MILAIDIGNTTVALGGIRDGRVCFVAHMDTVRTRTAAEYRAEMEKVFSHRRHPEKPIRFEPSAEEVLARVVPAYITGFLYSAMVDSFCAEQNARASAMDSANQNEDDMLRELRLEYNHERQGAITSEITEVSAGARSKKNHMKKEAQHAHR